MGTMRTLGDTLPAEDIVHVVPDGHEPAVYHWLYVKGGYVVKFNVTTGAIASSVKLPTTKAITEKADDPEQKTTTVSYHA
jgi:hypothetical protein